MKHASVHSQSPRQDTSFSHHRPIPGPDGIAIAPPKYGIAFVDQHQSTGAETTIQRQASEESSAFERQPENRTGLPDHLKAGIESLSGFDLSDVTVHFNSAKPAGLQALAYTQGTDIHVAPDQEKHLPHEAWYVVQQAQGRVHPTMQLKDGAPVNDDLGLEREADVMGSKAIRVRQSSGTSDGPPIAGGATLPAAFEKLSAPQLEIGEVAAQPVVDLRSLSITFPMDADGDGEPEEKRLFFRGRGPSTILMINPDPQPLETFLIKHPEYKDSQLIKFVSVIDTLTKKSGGISQDNGKRIASSMVQLADHLISRRATLGKDPLHLKHKIEKPPTHAVWTPKNLSFTPQGGTPITETVTGQLTVSPLSIVPPNTGVYGTKVQNSGTPYMQELRRWASYIRGHMLNSKIHGPGTDDNLVPISSTFNKAMERGIEKAMKDAVISQNKVVFYSITPLDWGHYKGSGKAPKHNAEEQLPNKFKIVMKLMKLKQPGADGKNPNNWEINTANKAVLFDATVPHDEPGTLNYNEDAEPAKVLPGVYELVKGQWWAHSKKPNTWVLDGVMSKQNYAGRDLGICHMQGENGPWNFAPVDPGNNNSPLPFNLINNQLVVICIKPALDMIKEVMRVNTDSISKLYTAVQNTRGLWEQIDIQEQKIDDEITKLIVSNQTRSNEYYAQAPEQVRKYDEEVEPFKKEHAKRVQDLNDIGATVRQVLDEIEKYNTEEPEFWKDQEALANGDQTKFWSTHETRERHSDDLQAWLSRNTVIRLEMTTALRRAQDDQLNFPEKLKKQEETFVKAHRGTLEEHADRIEKAKMDARERESVRRQWVTHQREITKNESYIRELASTILNEIIKEVFPRDFDPAEFIKTIERDYIQSNLVPRYATSMPLLNLQLEKTIRDDLEEKAGVYLVEKIIHDQKSAPSPSMSHEDASNPHSPAPHAPSAHNLGINPPLFGTQVSAINLNPPAAMESNRPSPVPFVNPAGASQVALPPPLFGTQVSAINLNQPEAMEINQGQPYATGHSSPPHKKWKGN